MAMPTIFRDHSPSPIEKLKSFICCFHHQDSLPHGDDSKRSPYSWLKSTAQDLEIREKCWGLIGRRRMNGRHRNSADFRYDLTSYLLNFEDENHRPEDELPLNNFTARLPVTPDRLGIVASKDYLLSGYY